MSKNKSQGTKLIFSALSALVIVTMSAKITYAQTSEEKNKNIEPNSYSTPYEANTSLALKDSNSNIRKIPRSSASFDLREYITIDVKNQMNTQAGWAYPLITGIETNISLTRGYNSPIFSTRHMEYATSKTFLNGINKNGYNREVGSGGNNTIGLSYLTSGLGPVLEKDMPFKDSKEKINLSEINKPVGQKVEQYVQFPSIYKTIRNSRVTYQDNEGNTLTTAQVKDIRDRIKNHIITYGGVTSATNVSETNYFDKQPSEATSYFCNNSTITSSHAITIIGWDDNYSKDNFKSSNKPSQNGAWLVLNNYGIGQDAGYYYISYEDVMIERNTVGIVTVVDKDYKNLYQYDILAQNINYKPTTTDEEGNEEAVTSAYVANIYNRKETTKEYLKDIAITGSGKTQNIDIYINKKGELNLEEATLVASNVQIAKEYKTIKLTTPVELTNDKFAVIVKYKNANQIEIGIEANATALGISGFSKWNTATAEEGEGFLSLTGENEDWQDITELVETGSLCIKAFTTTEDKTGPTIRFETNGNTTYKNEQGSKVIVTDPSGINESTLRYVWTQSKTQPNIEEFETWFENNTNIVNNTETGNNWYIWGMAKDSLGNVSYKRSEAFYLDNTPPTAPTITSNVPNGGWTSQTANITISGGTSLSGIERYEYTLNDGKDWSIGSSFSSEVDGIYKIKARAIGKTGLEGVVSEEYNIKIDKTPPSVRGIEEGGIYNYARPTIQDTTNLIAKLSKDGVERDYTIDNEGKGEEITQTGNYTLTLTDEVGNKTILHFIIDADPPTVTFTPNGDSTYKNSCSTVVNITDEHDIDQQSLKYIWAQDITTVTENLFNEGAQEFTDGQTITKNDGSGEYTLLIMAKDKLGNIALVKSKVFALDNTTPKAPKINSNIGNGAITNQTIRITIDGSFSPSGIKTYQYSLDNGDNWIDIAEGEELVLSETKEYNIIARAINNLDVIGATTEEYKVTISKEAPNISFTPNGSDNKYKKEQTTQINVSHTNELDQESFKYVWSQSETVPSDDMFEEDFYFGSKITKNTESGTWYIWAKATDTLGNTTIARSEAFLLDNEKPTAPEIHSNVPNNKPVKQVANVNFSRKSKFKWN